MSILIRPVATDEVEAFQHTMGIPFGCDPSENLLDSFKNVFEVERLRAAFDGDQMVATFGTFSFQMTVPGGKLPTGGTTVVTVLPTHRRQGILRSLMTEHLAEIHENQEPLAALWASESSIYGRFGYGPASERATVKLEKPYARMTQPIDIRASMRLVDLEEALSLFPTVYQQVASRRPGMLDRGEAWWKHRVFRDLEERRRGATSHRRVLHVRDGQPLGYVIYRNRINVEAGTGEVLVVELIGVNPEAEKALWQYIFGIDLVTTIDYWNQPIDAPLHWWLEQPRRLERKVEDQLWVRIVDVESALQGRRYAGAGCLTFRMSDPICPWNEGVYDLDVDAEGRAQCAQSRGNPNLELNPYGLAAAYLGGTRFRNLARAGIITGTPEGLKVADELFCWDPLPWCPEVF